MEPLRDQLQLKGMTPEQLNRTLDILERAEESKQPSVKMLDKVMYWLALIVAILGNFLFSVILIPIMLVMTSGYLYVTLFITGLAFGALINILLHDIEHVQRKSYIMPELFIPAIALINIYIIARLSALLISLMQLKTPPPDALFVSIAYVTAFMLPHALFKVRLGEKHIRQGL